MDWHIAKRNGPELRTRTRAEKRSFGASGEMLKIVLQMISRQNEKRSRSGIVSVDQNVMPAPREELSRKRPDNACCTLSQVDCAANQDRLWLRAYTTALPVTASHKKGSNRDTARIIDVRYAA